ncbi:MAG: hypothetical protein V7K67_21125, partial [Nostoc sp.]|uniref:hypothetical protein n=1 Tax=Nostoc sp. TaxID=1180 RepID=UPI002FFAD1B1
MRLRTPSQTQKAISCTFALQRIFYRLLFCAQTCDRSSHQTPRPVEAPGFIRGGKGQANLFAVTSLKTI